MACVVPTDRLPVPPLSALGLTEFADFENQPMSGITYKETYFLQRSAAATDESLHFHELVHIVQWHVLGPKDFLLQYAIGLNEQGYLGCPLEAMAYEHQRRFDAGEPSYSVETEVREQTLALKTYAANWARLGDSPGQTKEPALAGSAYKVHTPIVTYPQKRRISRPRWDVNTRRTK